MCMIEKEQFIKLKTVGEVRAALASADDDCRLTINGLNVPLDIILWGSDKKVIQVELF